MAIGTITVTKGSGQPSQNLYVDKISFVGDASYLTPGMALLALFQAAVGDGRLPIAIIPGDCGGYVPVYVPSTGKLKLYWSNSDAADVFAVALFCTAPLSPILQVSYAESMQLFLLFAALTLLLERRYWLMIPVIVVLAFTRPMGLAFALFLLVHLIHRFVVRRRDPFPVRERIAVLVAGLVSFLAGIAWPLIAWAVTGSSTAYTDTELAWRAGYVGRGELVPFQPWFQGARFWLGFAGVPAPGDVVLGTIGVVALVVGFALFLLSPWARRIGVDLRLWLASYAVYLLAVFFPQSSVFRLLVPFAPALGALAVPRHPAYRVSLIVLGIVGQYVWLYYMWWVNGIDWSPP